MTKFRLLAGYVSTQTHNDHPMARLGNSVLLGPHDEVFRAHLFTKVKFIAALFGKRSTQYTASVGDHKIHHFGRHFFGSTNKIAFIFTILIINNDYELTCFYVL